MLSRIVLLAAACVAASAETRPFTLREAVAAALRQNPDLVIARYDEAKARYGIAIAKDPFVPKVYAGSGAAYTTGYPVTINGQPPSIVESRAMMSIFNRPQSYKLAQSREEARTAGLELGRQGDDIAYRAASLWIDARQAAEGLEVARRQAESVRAVAASIEARVSEGRLLPIESKRAALDLARAGQRISSLAADLESAERALALVLGLGPDDRAQASGGEPLDFTLPSSADAAADTAVENSKELRVLDSRLQAKQFELSSYKSARWPVVDLVAQYNLLAKYNFTDFFGRFQRHNGQIGASITVPLLVGSAPRAYLGQAESELAKLQVQAGEARHRIALDSRKEHASMLRAETARNVARLDLDVAREQVSVTLAQQDEGRVTMREVEQARVQEGEKWMAYYEAQHALERAKLNLLRQTGTLVAALN